VATATGFQGQIHWDATKSDGIPKKQLNISWLAALGWSAHISLPEGLTSTVTLYLQALPSQLVRL
jgi:GDP-L-fucose synthase